jgi:hypothetical protein
MAISHACSVFAEAKDKAGLGTLMVAVLDTASVLAAHGCLDGVQVALVPNNGTTTAAAPEEWEYHGVAEILASGVFNVDLSLEKVELAALKFLRYGLSPLYHHRHGTIELFAARIVPVAIDSYPVPRVPYYRIVQQQGGGARRPGAIGHERLYHSHATRPLASARSRRPDSRDCLLETVVQVPVRSESVQSTGSYHVLPSLLIQL